MTNIAIDLGSYSIKIIHFYTDKKSTRLDSTEEIILDSNAEELSEHAIWELQLKKLSDYLSELNSDYQLIINFTPEIVSTRYIELPIKNKKKAIQMLPFQIEEDLPYPIHSCHYSETYEVLPEMNQTKALAGIIKYDYFNDFFSLLKNNKIHPNMLTYDASIYSSYIKRNRDAFPNSFCILEFGHEATRGYFFHEAELVANHHSFVAGKVITEDISKTYNISIEEAEIYKHQNAFVLSEDHFEQVNDNQKEFAILMNNTLSPLFNEIRRWEIGFRVKHGIAISNYFICGGTSNINNFTSYLHDKLKADVTFFDPFSTADSQNIDQDNKIKSKYAFSSMMAQSFKHKNSLINFLKGDFTFQENTNLPLPSLAFISSRVAVVCFVMSLFFLIDNFVAHSQHKKASVKASKLLSDPIFKIKPRERRTTLKKAPERILVKLQKKLNIIEEEISMIQSSIQINAMKPLINMLTLLKNPKVEIIQFQSISGKDFNLTLKSEDIKSLESIESALTVNNKLKITAEINTQGKTLTISGRENK